MSSHRVAICGSLAAFLVSVGCVSGPKVSRKEATSFTAGIQAVAMAETPERLRLMAIKCSSIAACSGKCGKELEGYGQARYRDRHEALQTCEAFHRYAATFEPDTTGMRADEWVHNQLRGFSAVVESTFADLRGLVSKLDRLIAGERVDLDGP